MKVERVMCYQCQGRGYKYESRMIGLVWMPVKQHCTTCSGLGYREVRK